ncbi:homeodomain-interacting protein kinase 2-like isoform X3 [Syngnathoides biaculeatus]|uniref:homeodomain-interacting protein kinase 2-like isoform X3 n=1 Tax=Syngnathoides biaculeatus TaxID=300417 RepID=UPI002ADE4850|nr:homeodomain-interacting protein kinase 2-like isoform X3 [Syngnathoides biaculeatus]
MVWPLRVRNQRMEPSNFPVTVESQISSPTCSYMMEELLGAGSFGEVVQCRKMSSGETVALKVIKDSSKMEDAKDEGQFCLEFEKLDMSLHQLLEWRLPLSVMEIRPVLQQLTTALQFLKSVGIVHCDLKPDNIMVVDHLQLPLKVKVIDFGLALHASELSRGMTVQSMWYRCPEVLLGHECTEAIDVWSLGCVAVELLLGRALFDGSDEYSMLSQISTTLGKLPASLLDAGIFTSCFFRKKAKKWRLKNRAEMVTTYDGTQPLNKLSDLLEVHFVRPINCSDEDWRAMQCDLESFVNLIATMLQMDPSKRSRPYQILEHPFVTMSHFEGRFPNSAYVKLCHDCMEVGQTCQNKETSVRPIWNMSSFTCGDHTAGPRMLDRSVITINSVNSLPTSNNGVRKRKRDDDDDNEEIVNCASAACKRSSRDAEVIYMSSIDSSRKGGGDMKHQPPKKLLHLECGDATIHWNKNQAATHVHTVKEAEGEICQFIQWRFPRLARMFIRSELFGRTSGLL